MVLYHADSKTVRYPEVRKSSYTMDFSWGFYCTVLKEQATRRANRGNRKPVVNTYDYDPSEDLRVLKFESMSDAWLDFIASCRAGNVHNYDVVEGPMADDTIWSLVNDFVHGTISREQFRVLADSRRPARQISFHTQSALDCLTFRGSEIIYDK